MLGRLKESTDLASASMGLARLEERSTKGQWYLPVLQSPETVALTTAPPALTVKIVSLVCHVCLVLFELLPFSWSLE